MYIFLCTHISPPHPLCANFVRFATFGFFFSTFAPMCKHVTTKGVGVCVYFLKSPRRGHFGKVRVMGGGDHILSSQAPKLGFSTSPRKAWSALHASFTVLGLVLQYIAPLTEKGGMEITSKRG